jgi:hypothetical protein
VESLQNGKNESNNIATIKRPSSMALVLAEMLNQVSLLYKTEILPGEVRIWLASFEGERVQMIEWAFAEYFKTGTFPPKPADITLLIRGRRAAMVAEYSGPPSHMSTAEFERLKKEREAYFASDEYKAWLAKMHTEHGL